MFRRKEITNKIDMKTYTELVSNTGDRIFKIKEGHNRITATMALNAETRTYFGLILNIWDDNFQYVKRNAWVFELGTYNIREVLKENGFTEAEPTETELMIHNFENKLPE